MPTQQTTYEDKMGMARLLVVKNAPYSGTIVHGFIYVAMPGIRTMLCTDTMVLGYDPAWVERASIEELAADIFHEVNHFMRRHHVRMKNAVRKDIANRAADHSINPDLRNAGWGLSTHPQWGAIFPEHDGLKEGLTMEEYYELLLKQEQEEQKKGGSSKGKSQKGGQKQDGAGGNAQGDPDGDGGGGEGEREEQQGGGVASGRCGSIAGGERSEWEEKLLAQPDVEPRTEMEIRSIEIRAAKDLREWQAKQAAGRGTMPAFLTEFLKALDEEPVVSWQDELATITYDCVGTMQSGGDDYSFRRPSKRSYTRGFPRPGLVEYQPEVAIVLDTSGSMGVKQLKAVLREIVGIMEALGIDEIWFCEADAAVAQKWERFHIDDLKELAIQGRGGTDFRPAIASAQELFPRPDILFYGTDGDGAAPNEPPQGMEVVWLIVEGHYNRAPTSWGHTIFAVDNKDKKHKLDTRHAQQQQTSAWDEDD